MAFEVCGICTAQGLSCTSEGTAEEVHDKPEGVQYGGPLGPFRSHFGVRRLELAVSGICSSHTGVLLQPFSSSSLGVSRFRYML